MIWRGLGKDEISWQSLGRENVPDICSPNPDHATALCFSARRLQMPSDWLSGEPLTPFPDHVDSPPRSFVASLTRLASSNIGDPMA
jgi:hypothetical protein